ncbi:MAG TPA: Ig-like domain-containing protein, partial [Candidatus Acidoferrum sp.]|nr:Ig-like domain-containing protein [Candidatus Acidoferrum sp.]
MANAQSVSTAEGVAKDITLTGTDADGDPLTYSIVDGPDHGALGAVSGANVTYTPTAGFAGADSFTFKVNDGTDDSAPATVDITVTPNTYVLTMGVSPADSGTATDVTDAGPYVAGTPVSISATPESGYHFVNWTSSNGGSFTDASSSGTTFTMPASATTVTANFVINSYTVTFVDYNDAVLKTEDVAHGGAATAPTDPDNMAGHHFTGWDRAFDNVTEPLTVKALYDINSYTVTFVDYNDAVLKTENVAHGGAATAPANPDNMAGHHFTAWDKAFDNVTEPLTVKALYDINIYTVTFVDYNDAVLKTEDVAHGGAATAPTDPDNMDGHHFTAWDKAFDNVTEPLTVKALYDINIYTVKWIVEGAETDEDYDYNAMPSYKGGTPTKAGNAQYSYTFSGWDPDVVAVTEDATYTAQFDSETVEYAIGWDTDGDGDVDDTTMVAYGTVPTHVDGAKASTVQYDYTFDGWDPTVMEVDGATTYTATFNSTLRSYTIGWDTDGDGDVDDSAAVAFGTVPTHADGAKASTAQYDYTFSGWDPTVVAVAGEATYTATFNSTLRSYTIGWDTDGDGNVDDSATVNYGVMPAHADGVKVADAE